MQKEYKYHNSEGYLVVFTERVPKGGEMTQKQWDFILKLASEAASNYDSKFQHPFRSCHEACSFLTKRQASEIINALKNGMDVYFNTVPTDTTTSPDDTTPTPTPTTPTTTPTPTPTNPTDKYGRPVFDENGEVIHYCGVDEDGENWCAPTPVDTAETTSDETTNEPATPAFDWEAINSFLSQHATYGGGWTIEFENRRGGEISFNHYQNRWSANMDALRRFVEDVTPSSHPLFQLVRALNTGAYKPVKNNDGVVMLVDITTDTTNVTDTNVTDTNVSDTVNVIVSRIAKIDAGDNCLVLTVETVGGVERICSVAQSNGAWISADGDDTALSYISTIHFVVEYDADDDVCWFGFENQDGTSVSLRVQRALRYYDADTNTAVTKFGSYTSIYPAPTTTVVSSSDNKEDSNTGTTVIDTNEDTFMDLFGKVVSKKEYQLFMKKVERARQIKKINKKKGVRI